MWRRSKTEWFHLHKTKRGCRLLQKSRFLQQLRSSMQEEDLERIKKFGSEKVCLGSSFAEHKKAHITSAHPNQVQWSLPIQRIRNQSIMLSLPFNQSANHAILTFQPTPSDSGLPPRSEFRLEFIKNIQLIRMGVEKYSGLIACQKFTGRTEIRAMDREARGGSLHGFRT
ncbi:hypothetical protein Bca101_092491 [Brassica carinata]